MDTDSAYKSEKRIDYTTLKEWALSSYFDFCRDRGIVLRMSHMEVIGYISYDFEYGFARPVEDLMWRVILLVLSGGWHPESDAQLRKTILDDIEKIRLDHLLINVPTEEADEFRHDLKILKLI